MARKRKVLLHTAPFFTMAMLSPAEVYKRETYGFLFGLSNGDSINLAYPEQTTTRNYNVVKSDTYLDNYIINLAKYHNLTFFGDYHSHTDGYHKPAVAELSEFDEKFLRKNPGLVSVVIALNSKWSHLKGEMAGFYYDKKEKEIKQIEFAPTKRLEKILESSGFTLSEFYIDKQKKDKIKNK